MRSVPMLGCKKPILCFVRVSVAPARAEYSPPEREVGMFMMGIVHAFALAGLESMVKLEISLIV